MAELHITEYTGIGQDKMGRSVQVAHGERERQVLPITESGSVSAAFQGDYIRVFSDVPCRIQFGAAPTATDTSIPLAGDSVEFFHVIPGHKLAVISR
ncbi:MAG: hypothetical protein EA406_03470 [Rhodospirillales bacterium]|nr:MAG: hypothetical protein EA406_03470 [Rhodospirillales bacterium]